MIDNLEDNDPTKLTVLLVEDNAQFRQLISDFLSFAGYKVISTVNAVEALSILEQSTKAPDLIISDIIMAKIDGCEFLHIVRSHWKHIPFVMMSTSDSFEKSCPGFTQKPEAYIAKPFSYEELIHVILSIPLPGSTI
jgi:CheY-like chemotaxis protein